MRRLRQHVNPLSGGNLARRAGRLSLPADRVVELELGCGDGQFLFERARAAPEGHYVGVEIREEFCDAIRRAGAHNVEAVCANLLVADDLLAPRSVTRLHVNFPDPLWKRRHRPRRWLVPETARKLCEAVRDGGEIFFQTDVFEVALDALAVLEAEPALANAAGEWRFTRVNPYGARSRREQWCEEHGLPVWRLLFRKK